MRTIRGRLVLTYLLLVTLSLVLTGVFFLTWMERSLERRAEAQLASQSRVLGHFMSMYTQHPDDLADSARWVMKEFPRLTRARVRIADSEGRVVGDSRSGDATPLRLQARAEVAVTWTEDPRIVHVTTPIRLTYPREETVGYVDVSSRLAEIDDTFEELRLRLLGALALALGASWLGAVLMASNLTRPIEGVRTTAQKIAEGDLDRRVRVESDLAELNDLGQTVNHMAAQLQQRLNQIVAQRNKIQSLMASLPDPVLTVGSEQTLTYLNPAAEKALELPREQAVGRKLAEVWPEEFDDRLTDRLPEPTAFELRFHQRVFRAYLLPYRDEKGEQSQLIILRDMTDIRRLEEVRTLFLGSVSHELRTPLTIIKGFAATLADLPEVEEAVRKPLQKIDQEADRLTRLVNDLLDLTKMRSRKLSLELEPLCPEEVVEEAVDLLRSSAARQGLALQTHCPDTSRLSADRDRLKQIVINLVDNALKFTPEGGRVSVRTEQTGHHWQLIVEDTGPGVSPEELPNLFEHFFRSGEMRKMGGTGLGLAIVAEIVDMHQGRVWAESELGEGTRVIVTLPV